MSIGDVNDPADSNASVQPDGSTVRRVDSLSDHSASDPVSGRPAALSDAVSEISPVDEQQVEDLAEAKTVIRGSKRENPPAPGPSQTRQTPATVAKVLLGQRLNHFRIDTMIGGGGMGAVFLAQDEQLDRAVAIKVIPFVGDDAELQRRFRNESQSAAKLDHPGIAKVFDAGKHDDWHYIVFEYVEGTNLRDWVINQGPLSLDDAVLFTCQIAEALQHASERGIVHRDVKPSNILLSQDGKIKLVDMGLARSDNLEFGDDMTASGVTLGTFDYISPEQAHDPRDADLRSDIYSLGCTLYFMLTGQPPYPGGTMLQKLLSHGNAPPPDPRLNRQDVSENLAAVLDRMLAKKPASRYQNAKHLIADLREVASRDGLTGAQAVGPVEYQRPNPMLLWLEQHLPWITAVAIVLLIAGWLHLRAVVSRQEITIPQSAKPLTVWQPPIRMGEQVSESGLPGETGGSGTAEKLDEAATDYGAGAATEEDGSITQIPMPAELLDQRSPAVGSNPSEEADADARAEIRVDPVGSGTDATVSAETGMPSNLVSRDSTTVDAVDAVPGLSPGDVTADDGVRSVPGRDNAVADWQLAEVIDLDDLRSGLLDDIEYSEVHLFASEQVGGLRRLANKLYTPSLAVAIEIAERSGLDLIRIDSRVINSDPVAINQDNLRIESTVGGSMIVFNSSDFVSMRRPSMCSIGPNRVYFRDLHFVWDVPEDELNGGSLFAITAGSQVTMSDTTVTVANSAFREEVFVFDVTTDPERMPTSQRRQELVDDVFPLVIVELGDVIVRGQATMVHMDYGAKLWLEWNNGLLSITERMIDTAGARAEPVDASDEMKLVLNNVIAHAQQGLCRVRIGVSGDAVFPIYRSARNSVFIVDRGRPHFEVLSSVDSLPGAYSTLGSSVPLRLDGSSNSYDTDPTLLDPLVKMTSTDGKTYSATMGELVSGGLRYADENRPQWSVDWISDVPPGIPASIRRPNDYQLDGVNPVGFDAAGLPSTPNWPETIDVVSPTGAF